MDITPSPTEGRRLVEGYGDGHFIVSGTRYKGSLVVTPESVTPWPVTAFAEATPDSLGFLAEVEKPVELLLLGSGSAQAFLKPALRRAFKERLGVVVECMASGAACRTYNVLATEDRRVAAALIAVF